MASTYLALLFVIHLATLVLGIQQEVTIYTESNQSGDAITFRSSQSELSGNNTKSYCATGPWKGFTLKDFEHYAWDFGSFTEQTICSNYNGPTIISIRRLGASDTLTQALSLYEGNSFAGREIFVPDLASNNFPFNPIRYVSSGKTVWTLFEGSNFDGNSTCTMPAPPQYNMFYGNISPLQVVGSVVKGCGAEAENNITNYNRGYDSINKS